MEIEDCTALVTGANRGLGRAFVDALLRAGATKVYAGARDPAAVLEDPRVTPIQLDVTSGAQVAEAVSRCGDTNILINNAAVMLPTPVLDGKADEALHRELEVNVFGPLSMARAFAPALARNGGGAIVNMLSVVSWYVYPFNPTYCASKFAALAITDALRIELKAQGTRVIGVHAGFLDTDMAAQVTSEKTPPSQVAERTLAAVRTGENHVHADQAAEYLWAMTRKEPETLEQWAQQIWDQGRAWAV